MVPRAWAVSDIVMSHNVALSIFGLAGTSRIVISSSDFKKVIRSACMKKYFPYLLSALCGSLIGAGVILQLAPTTPDTNQPTPSAIPEEQRPGIWQKVVSDVSLNVVAVQTFQGSRLLRQGSGIVLSSDGLIVTTYDAAPARPASGSGGPYLYQIAYGDKVLRAKLVARDYRQNLSLLKVDVSDLGIIPLSDSIPHTAGRELLLVGKFVDLSRPVDFAQRAIVHFATDKSIALDTTTSAIISGSAALDISGKALGMAYVRGGKTYLIPVATLKGFLEGYLRGIKK